MRSFLLFWGLSRSDPSPGVWSKGSSFLRQSAIQTFSRCHTAAPATAAATTQHPLLSNGLLGTSAAQTEMNNNHRLTSMLFTDIKLWDSRSLPTPTILSWCFFFQSLVLAGIIIPSHLHPLSELLNRDPLFDVKRRFHHCKTWMILLQIA